MFAALHPDLDLLGCTTVWGNLEVPYTTDNTLRVLDHVGRGDVAVYQGSGSGYAPRPFPVEPGTDKSRGKIHARELPIPAPVSAKRDTPAVEWLVETLRSTTEQITLVPVGPLTNIAAAVAADRSIVDAVAAIVIMGGGHEIGNVTPSAEFNIWNDPVAADVVLNAGFDTVVLVPLDATHRANVSADQCRELNALDTPAGSAAAAFIAQRIAGYDETQPMAAEGTAPVHDALCIAYLVNPDVVELENYHVAIETTGYLTYGRTVIDTHHRGGHDPNAFVAMNADADLFFQLLKSTFAGLAGDGSRLSQYSA
jgi:inosine-uridine nucleoside N-ribohydrolase